MKKRISVMALLIVLVMTPLVASAGPLQQDPTATPTDPGWVAFATARAAIEEEHNEDLTWVKTWTYEEAEWEDGIDGCRTLDAEAGETARQVFFGWTVTITSLYGSQYQARVSFNYKLVSVCDEVVQTTTAAVEADPDSNLPAPVTGSANTGTFALGGQVTGMYPNALSVAKSAGMTWLKMQLQMGMDGSGFVSEAHANGFKILFSVVGDHAQVMSESYQNSFAAYLGTLASAGADAIEVWNEPNIDREWPAGQISGANYVALLAKAYNAIKTANANTLVIAAAPSPTGYFGTAGCTSQGCNDDVFYQQMAAAGAGNYADCIGVHYNEGTTSPKVSTGAAQGDNYPTRYFGTMLNRALAPFGGKQACFTELGYLSGEGYPAIPSGFAWGSGTSIAEQATWLAEAAVLSASGGRVRLMIIFNVNFHTVPWTSDPMAGYAIIRADGSCPACSTLAGVMK
ncbi:MAG: hypothetical protein JXA10_04690 [Anaerolineae bacterium]|nr:hypothetical protein [Anaerolineae bacterium]